MNTEALNIRPGKAHNVTGYVVTYNGTFLSVHADERDAVYAYQQYLLDGGVRLFNGPAQRFIAFGSKAWHVFAKNS